MTIRDTKQTGNVGEEMAVLYLRKRGFTICARNFSRKTGEIDIVAKQSGTLHVVEVKSAGVDEFPLEEANTYDPAMHIHGAKIKRLIRTGEWYVLHNKWAGDWQIDAILIRIRRRDGLTQIRYIPQIT